MVTGHNKRDWLLGRIEYNAYDGMTGGCQWET